MKKILLSISLALALFGDISYQTITSEKMKYFSDNYFEVDSYGNIFAVANSYENYKDKTVVAIAPDGTTSYHFSNIDNESSNTNISIKADGAYLYTMFSTNPHSNTSGTSYIVTFYKNENRGAESLIASSLGGYHSKIIDVDGNKIYFLNEVDSSSGLYLHDLHDLDKNPTPAQNTEFKVADKFDSYGYSIGLDGAIYSAVSEYSSELKKSLYDIYKLDKNSNSQTLLIDNSEFEFFKFTIASDGVIFNAEELFEDKTMLAKLSRVSQNGVKEEIKTYSGYSIDTLKVDKSGNLFFILSIQNNFDNKSLYILKKGSNEPEELISNFSAHTANLEIKNEKVYIFTNSVGYGHMSETNLNQMVIYHFDNENLTTNNQTATETDSSEEDVENNILNVSETWQLRGGGKAINTSVFNLECIKRVYVYTNSSWKVFIPFQSPNFEIKKWQGFWIIGQGKSCKIDAN